MKESATTKVIIKSSVVMAVWFVFTSHIYAQKTETSYVHIPTTVSQEAWAYLRMLPDPKQAPAWPAPDEIEKWKAVQQAAGVYNLEKQKPLVDALQPSVTKRNFGGVPVLDIKPKGRQWQGTGIHLPFVC